MEGPYERRLLRVLRHIQDNPAGDLSLDALAGVAALGRFHFHRVFRAMTGETAAGAVRRIRMDRAARWLVHRDWPLAEVARAAGYPDPRSFSRAFSQVFGLTPAAFRKRGEARSLPLPQPKGQDMSHDIRVETEPPRHCAGLAHRGPYMEIGRTFETLGTLAAARGLGPRIRAMLGVYHDDPASVAPQELRAHACLELAPDTAVPEGLETVDLPGGRVAVLTFRGHYADLPAAYGWLYGPWLAQSGEEPRDAPVVELYLNTPAGTPPEELLTEIRLPLK